MMGVAENTQQEQALEDLRARLAQVRRELMATTDAYRQALARQDSSRTIPLLRTRSQLMRRLLDTQCELLLAFRSGEVQTPTADGERMLPQ